MVHIAPFRALRYNGQDMTKVTSPPHDVITPEERDDFLAADDHNVCQVILPAGGDEKYAAAKAALEAWQQDGAMVRDTAPGFYVYEIKHPGGTMRGFFCRIAIDADYQSIKRHEMTLPKKRSDRLSLLEATGVNTESIWMLYRDERGWVDEILSSNAIDELHRFTDEQGLQHRVWRVDRPEAVAEIQAQFEDRDVVIADGHHRYATQVKHWQATGREADASMLVCMVRDTDAGLAILPTNRLLRTFPFSNLADGVAKAAGWVATALEVPAGSAEDEAEFLREHVVDARTVVVFNADSAWSLRFDGALDQGRGRLDELAVTALHDHLLTAHWGVDMDHVEDHLHYSRSDAETVARIRAGEYPVAVMLAPEPVDAVLDVAMQGYLMPQKATYFVPKLRSGLVMSPCDEPLPRALDYGLNPGPADFRMPKL